MEKLTQEELKRQLNYNSDTGDFTWNIKKKHSRFQIGDIAGCKVIQGYIVIKLDAKVYKAHRLAWLYMEGYLPENEIDHINRIKNDNRWKNLRHVSRKCNRRNSGIARNNKSGITGISWAKSKEKWNANIKINHKAINLGYFENKDDAVEARWKAENKYNYPTCNTTSTAFNYLKENNLIEINN